MGSVAFATAYPESLRQTKSTTPHTTIGTIIWRPRYVRPHQPLGEPVHAASVAVCLAHVVTLGVAEEFGSMGLAVQVLDLLVDENGYV